MKGNEFKLHKGIDLDLGFKKAAELEVIIRE